MRMQVILDSLFARPGSAPIGAERKESLGTGLAVLRRTNSLTPKTAGTGTGLQNSWKSSLWSEM